MANLPISQLPDATALSGGELLPIVQSGVTKKIPITSLPIIQLPSGSASVGFIQFGTGAVPQTVQDKLRQGFNINAKDHGAVLDGVTDDTAAIQKTIDALDALGFGGCIIFDHAAKCLINGTLNLKPNIKLMGVFRHGVMPAASGNYYSYGSQIRLGTAGKIVPQKGSGLENLLVIRDGLYTTVPANPTQANAVVANFTGTAIDINAANDVYIVNCMLLGHALAVSCVNSDRLYMDDVLIDSTSGVYVTNAFDICRLHKVHCWPFLTATVPGVGNTPNDPTPNRRTGFGFKLESFCDWSTLSDCFEYGYSRGFWLSSTSNVMLSRCQADYTNPNTGSIAGFYIEGQSTYSDLSGCTAIATANGVLVDTTGGAASDSAVKLTSIVFANTAECILINNGNVTVNTCSFHSGTVGVSFAAGADTSSVVGCTFDGVATDFAFASATIQRLVTRIGNCWQDTTPSSAPERIAHFLTVQKDNVVMSLMDTVNFTGGAGAVYKTEQFVEAGMQDAIAIKSYLVSATAGNEAVAMRFGTNRNGSINYRLQLHQDGHWIPLTDNAYSLGLAGNRWTVVYATTGAINTSDERQKEQVNAIDERVLKAWAKVNFRQFKFIEAVNKKGDKARWHFGVLAQQVMGAFQSEGLNPFDYGVLCFDAWEEVPEVKDEKGNILQERVPAGESYGVRYEEALVLECAYLRSRLG